MTWKDVHDPLLNKQDSLHKNCFRIIPFCFNKYVYLCRQVDEYPKSYTPKG